MDEGQLLVEVINLGLQPGRAIPIVAGPGEEGGEAVMDERQDLEDRELDPAVLAMRQRDLAAHGRLRENTG